METGDHELLQQCRQGSPHARERFVRRYAGLVHWAVRKTLSENPGFGLELADVFQDVFRKIFEPGTLDAVREASALKSWLVIVATRTALDAGRKISRRRGRESSLEAMAVGDDGEALTLDVADAAPGPADKASENEKAKLVQSAIGLLGPRERACVRYYYLEGWTHARIGDLLGLSKDAVSAIIHRSRERLKASLKEKGFEK